MSSTTAWVMIILALWLAALTATVIAIVRAMGLLELSRRAAANGAVIGAIEDEPFEFASDGPPVGSVLSEEAQSLLPDGVRPDGSFVAVLFSKSCEPCLHRAEEWAQILKEAPITSLAMISGPPKHGFDIEAALAGSGTHLIAGEDSSHFAKELGIQSVPFGVVFTDGSVSSKTYIRSLEDLHHLHDNALQPTGDQVEAADV